jgi:polyhydroxybutyrate depolymerase
MSIHGTQDSYFLYQGGYYLSMDAVTNYWTSYNQTQTTQPTETVTYDGLIIEKFSHTQGSNGSKVDHYKINGGYHIWFDLDFNGDSTEDLIWNFVSGYDKNGAR